MKNRRKSILVIGGTGFIGSNIVRGLTKINLDVTILSRGNKNTNLNHKLIRTINANILNHELLKRILDTNYDVVIHSAGESNRIQYELTKNTTSNYLGVKNVLEVIGLQKVKPKFILIASRLEYGKAKYLPVDELHPTQPLSRYGLDKLNASLFTQDYCSKYAIPYVIFRLSNVFGPHPPLVFENYNVVNFFLDRAKKGFTLNIFGSGSQLRDYLYINDLVDAIITEVNCDKCVHEVYNLGSGQPISFGQFIKLISKATKAPIVYTEWPKTYKHIESGDYITNISKYCSSHHWRPNVSYEKGITLICNNRSSNTDPTCLNDS